MKINLKNKLEDNDWIRLTAVICTGVVLFVTLTHLGSILQALSSFLRAISPVIYGVVLAYLISPLVSFFENKVLRKIQRPNVRHQLANASAIVLLIVLFAILMSFLIPQVVDSLTIFIGNLNSYAERLQNTLKDIIAEAAVHNLDLSVLNNYTSNLLSDCVTFLTSNASRIAAGSLSVTNNALNVGLGLILTVYFLVYKNTIMSSYHLLLDALLPREQYINVTRFISRCNRIMATYVVSDVLDACIIGIVNAFYMAVTRTPYLALISVVVGVMNLLPTFGPFIGAFIAGLILLFASPESVIPFLVFTLALQLVDGYIIKPRLFAGFLGVPGVWITLGIIVGAKLFGFIGILLSVPAIAVISFIMESFIEKRKAAKYHAADS